MSAPLPHVQYLEKALQIESFLGHAEKVFKESISDSRYTSDNGSSVFVHLLYPMLNLMHAQMHCRCLIIE